MRIATAPSLPPLALAAVALLATLHAKGQAPQQQQPPVLRLVYDLPVDALQRASRGAPEHDLEQALAATVEVLRARLGDDVEVRREGASGCVVVLPAGRAADVAAIRRLVETPAALELRIAAAGDRAASETTFALAAERARLRAWLDAGGTARVLADPAALREFHADAAKGPIAGGQLQWRVHRVRRSAKDPEAWEPSFRDHPALAGACVPLFGDAEWNGGRVPAPRDGQRPPDSLLELVALDFAQRGFGGDDVDPDAVTETVGPDGLPAIGYRMKDAVRPEYGDWSERNVGRASVVVWNGEIVAAPTFLGRIDGPAVLTGALPQAELLALARYLRTGSAIVPPRFVREEPVPVRR